MKKWIKRSLVFVITIIIITGLAFWIFTQFFLRDMALKQVNHVLEKQFENYYHFTFDAIEEDLNGTKIDLKITGIEWFSDTSSHKAYPPIFFDLEAIEIEGLGLWSLWAHHQIKVKKIHLKPGKLYFENEGHFKSRKNHKKNVQLDQISIEDIAWEDLDVVFWNKDQYLSLEGFHFQVKALKSALNHSNVFEHTHYNYFDIALDSLYFKNKGLYQYALKNLDLRPDQEALSIGKIYIKTLDAPKHLADRDPYQKSIFNIAFEDFRMQGIDLHQWMKSHQLHVESIAIANGDMYMYRDNSKPFFSKPRPYFQDLIWKIPVPLYVQEIKVDLKQFYVDLRSPKERRTHLDLTRVRMQMKHLSNHGKEWMDLSFKFNLFNGVPFECHTAFSPRKGNYQHRFKGSMGKMDMRDWNEFAYAMAGIQIKNGHQQAMSFDFNCDHKGLEGKMNLLYTDLKLSVMNAKKHHENKVLSALSGLVIHHNHPKEGHHVKPVPVSFQTHPDRFHVHLWINAIVQGFENAMLNVHIDGDKKYKKEQKHEAHLAKKAAHQKAHEEQHHKHKRKKHH